MPPPKPMTDIAVSCPVRLRHRMPGRTRISLIEPLPSGDAVDELGEHFAALDGVEAVDIRRQTGSIVIVHNANCDPLAAAIRTRLIEIVPESPKEPFDPAKEILHRVGQFNSCLAQASEGRVDAWGLAFTGLVAAGLLQVARGRVLGPATALFGQAATLAMARPLQKFVR